MSQLSKLLESFLSIEYFREDGFEMPLSLFKQYQLLDLPRHQKSMENSLASMLEKMPLRNADYFQKQLIFKRLQYEYSDPNEHNFNEKIQMAADALDLYFIVDKLRMSSEMQNMNNLLNLQYRLPFIGQIMGWAAGEEFTLEPTVQVYRQIFLMLHNTEEFQHFKEAKKLISTHGHRFEAHELKQLYTLLLNYATRRINRFNDEIFWHEYLEINKLLLENGLIFENGYLPPWRYTNLVTVGLRTGQTEWAHDFIHQFRRQAFACLPENLFRYNLAQFHFHQKDFDKAQRQICTSSSPTYCST
ncbi:MAG: hypothetical protein IPM82_14675 [Saprospiraceae bacterium]|nr:hypothetical protein [Saprospiraceae bacterium]